MSYRVFKRTETLNGAGGRHWRDDYASGGRKSSMHAIKKQIRRRERRGANFVIAEQNDT